MARTVVKKKKNMKGRKRGGASVPCPDCQSNSNVVITRRVEDEVIRNRICTGRTKHTFTTVEHVAS